MHVEESVLIVGAGPTGLVLALCLSKQGCRVRIIDKNPGPGKHSRAIAVHARTLEFYQQLGIEQDIRHAGIRVDQVTFRKSGTPKARINFGPIGKGLSPFPFLYFIAQDVHEGLLLQHLQQQGVGVEWETRLIDLQQVAHAVHATLQHKNQTTVVTVPYLCGCDGAHSTVRKLIKARFAGETYPQLFYVADVVTPALIERLELNFNKKDLNILMPVRQSGSIRVIGMIEQSAQADHYPETAQRQLLQRTGIQIEKINWFSPYHVHHRMVENFSTGRVFLLGDAAHIHSPAGGQGMNTGIGDAVNLAWKLATVLRGEANDQLLATYNSEREPFAKLLLSTTDRAFRALSNQSLLGRLFRYTIFPGLLALGQHLTFIQKKLFKMVSQIRIKYPQSPLSLNTLRGTRAGDRLPWVTLPQGDNYQPLQSLNWQCHVYGNVSTDTLIFAAQLQLPLHFFAWQASMNSAGFCKDGLYLIRPDGYIAVAIRQTELAKLKQYIKQWGLSFAAKPDYSKAKGAEKALQPSSV